MQPRRTWTILHANGVLLISLVLLLGGSLAMGGWPTYWVLTVRELAFILLPACMVVLFLKAPLQEKARLLRLRWPGGRVVALSVLIGAGGWLVDSWLAVVVTELLGYAAPLPPDFFPTTPGKALFLLIVLAVLAPICEETLFRGVIQRGYEELSPLAGILAGGALFALFHQSLPQGLALLPLAFVLGYLVWRSDSLWAGVMAHATNNALAWLLIVAATADPDVAPFVGSLPAALVGLALLLSGLWGLRRWTAPPPSAIAPAAGQRRGGAFWLVRLWPLLLILPLAAFSMGLEALLGWFPEALALGQPVRWIAPPWTASQTWTYEIRTVVEGIEEPIGQAQCALALEETAYVLTCRRVQAAYEVDTGKAVYAGGDVDEQWTARWQRPGLRLSSVDRDAQIVTTGEETVSRISSVVPGADAVEVTIHRDDGAPETTSLALEPYTSPLRTGRALAPTVLERSEWPWRFSALPFDVFYSAQATMVDPYARDDGEENSAPAAEHTSVVIYGAEPVKTAAGTFIAWRVQVGDEVTAWYDVERPHALVGLENGVEVWVLTE